MNHLSSNDKPLKIKPPPPKQPFYGQPPIGFIVTDLLYESLVCKIKSPPTSHPLLTRIRKLISLIPSKKAPPMGLSKLNNKELISSPPKKAPPIEFSKLNNEELISSPPKKAPPMGLSKLNNKELISSPPKKAPPIGLSKLNNEELIMPPPPPKKAPPMGFSKLNNKELISSPPKKAPPMGFSKLNNEELNKELIIYNKNKYNYTYFLGIYKRRNIPNYIKKIWDK
jgi:hypothetical protein